MNKNTKIALSAVFLVVLGVAGYSLVVKKSQTDDWKTYTNSYYGFELKYPPDASLSLDDHVPPWGTDLILPCDGSSGIYGNTSECGMISEKDGLVGDMIFWVFQEPMVNLEAYARSYGEFEDIEYKKISINGQDAYQLYFKRGSSTDVYIQNSEHVFRFSYEDDSKKISEVILSTLKFTEINKKANTTCLAIVTKARNIQTGEIKVFPSCIPEGWGFIGYPSKEETENI